MSEAKAFRDLRLDVRTLRSLARKYRRDAKGPKRNYDESPRLPRGWPSEDTKLFTDGEFRGYWRGWYCALNQLADELLEDARRLSKPRKTR